MAKFEYTYQIDNDSTPSGDRIGQNFTDLDAAIESSLDEENMGRDALLDRQVYTYSHTVSGATGTLTETIFYREGYIKAITFRQVGGTADATLTAKINDVTIKEVENGEVLEFSKRIKPLDVLNLSWAGSTGSPQHLTAMVVVDWKIK